MHKLHETKEKLIEELHRELEHGTDGVDIRKVSEVVDMVKDLAEAEKECWETCYYMDMLGGDAPERMGYTEGGNGQGRMQGTGTNGGSRMGYKNQYGNWPANPNNRSGYTPYNAHVMGYSGDTVNRLRDELRNMDANERRNMLNELGGIMQEADRM